MKATLTELHRQTKKVLRPVLQGQAVQLTEHGQVVAQVQPDCDSDTVPAEEMRKMQFTDAAIVEAVKRARR